ncbi:motile sperm domain-containing protein 2-like [Brevipalpus obovatus]|uniref:motile sperm domain-containing protein 2-like n=1 Tax=Brevipalpus obovatus TaxID=246614 RepID=UPI003D9F7D85
MEESKEAIDKVRDITLAEVEKDPISFEDVDVQRVCSDDAYIYRFVEDRSGKIDDAAKMLVETLRWRKSYGVNHMKVEDFPAEIFRVAELFEFHPDKNGISTLYLRIDRHRPVSKWKEIIRRFIVFNIEQAEKVATQNNKGIGLVVDARNGKIYHVEIDLDLFTIKTILNYYPGCLQYLAIFEIPWVLMAILKLVKSWCPAHYQDKFKFINKSNVNEFIGLENLPEFMGGCRPMLWPKACFTAPLAVHLEETGVVPQGSCDQLNKNYNFALQEFYQSKEYIDWKNQSNVSKNKENIKLNECQKDLKTVVSVM